jgi:hypothetical protein
VIAGCAEPAMGLANMGVRVNIRSAGREVADTNGAWWAGYRNLRGNAVAELSRRIAD